MKDGALSASQGLCYTDLVNYTEQQYTTPFA